MFNGLNIGLQNGQSQTHNIGLANGSFPGLAGPNDSNVNPTGSYLFNSPTKYFVSSEASMLNSIIKGIGQMFSIESWFKRVIVDGTYQTIYSRDGNAGQRQFAIEFDPSEKYTFFISDDASNYSWWKTVDSFTDTDNWYHLVITFNNNLSGAAKCVIYVNKVVAPTDLTTVGTGVVTVNNKPNEPVYVGVTNFGGLINPIKGLLHNVTFYNGVLSQADVTALYDNKNQGTAIVSIPATLKMNANKEGFGAKGLFGKNNISKADFTFDVPYVFRYNLYAQALFLAMTTPPTEARKVAIHNFIAGCINDGNWNLIDALWFTAAETQQASTLNWTNPSVYTLTEVGTPTWTADQGYTGNGSTMYLNTNYNPTANGVNYTLNNNSYGAYLRLNLDESTASMGHFAPTSGSFIVPRAANTISIKNNSNNFLTSGSSDSRKLLVGRRVDSATHAIWKNGVQVTTGARASVSMPNNNMYLLGYNNNGVLTSPSNNQVAFAFVGSSAIDQLKLNNRVVTYLTALGAAI